MKQNKMQNVVALIFVSSYKAWLWHAIELATVLLLAARIGVKINESKLRVHLRTFSYPVTSQGCYTPLN